MESITLIDVKKKDHGEDYRVTYQLNLKAVKNLLEKSHANGMRVAVISVTGKMRSGKSFILDFFSRYAKRRYVYNKKDKEWMGNKDQPLREGFSWSTSLQERETVGIQIPPEFFICNVNGERVCIILLDTQGSHDNESTWQEMAGIFALSTLTSSVQIYNVRNRIDDADLFHLEKFCAYTNVVTPVGLKPFQKIIFLVRDWASHNQYEFGFEGGYNYLKDTVFRQVKEPERLKTRHNVRSQFKEMACFLMPDPGEAAKSRRSFEGKIKDLSPKFIEQLDQFVPSVLSPSNLVLKEVIDRPVTVETLFENLHFWVQRFNAANVPAMTAMVNTTTEVKRLQLKHAALTLYTDKMDEFCKSRMKIDEKELIMYHLESKEAALRYFNAKAEIADEATIRVKHKHSLLGEIEVKYEEYKEENSSKLFKRERLIFLPCISIPVFAITYAIDRNSWMVSQALYRMTIILFWLSALTMAYWSMMMFSWLVTGCTRTTINSLFWFYVALQVSYELSKMK